MTQVLVQRLQVGRRRAAMQAATPAEAALLQEIGRWGLPRELVA